MVGRLELQDCSARHLPPPWTIEDMSIANGRSKPRVHAVQLRERHLLRLAE